MSSTNRGSERHEHDYYVTPKWCVREFLDKFIEVEGIKTQENVHWLDAGCGGDEFNDASYMSVIQERHKEAHLVGVDIREDSRATFVGDFLNLDFSPKFDIVITNPPFSQAVEFIEKALTMVRVGGYVIMLQRINFFGSKTRRPFFQKNMPHSLYIHSRRPNFIPENMQKERKLKRLKRLGGDSNKYGHFVWKRWDVLNDHTKTYLI